MSRTVLISPIVEPTLERVGFPLEHPYLELVYTSVLGPSSVLALRHIGRAFESDPTGVRVELVELSRSLGLEVPAGAELGRSSPLLRTLDRLMQFRLADWLTEDRLGVARRVPAVSASRAQRLPAPVRLAHHQLLDAHLAGLVATAERHPGVVGVAGRLAAYGPTSATHDQARSVRR